MPCLTPLNRAPNAMRSSHLLQLHDLLEAKNKARCEVAMALKVHVRALATENCRSGATALVCLIVLSTVRPISTRWLSYLDSAY